MDTLNLDPNKRYTYADYLTWMDDVRRELHDGFIKLMSPAPSSKHQEISPKNPKRDLKDKFEIYQEHGVREYWIVNPNDENINVFVMGEDGKFHLTGMYAEDDKIPVHIFNGDLQVDLTEVFVQ